MKCGYVCNFVERNYDHRNRWKGPGWTLMKCGHVCNCVERNYANINPHEVYYLKQDWFSSYMVCGRIFSSQYPPPGLASSILLAPGPLYRYTHKHTRAAGEGACARAKTHKHREHWSHTCRVMPVLHLATDAYQLGCHWNWFNIKLIFTFLVPSKLIERKPPPRREGFLFTMFPHQEPWVRGPPNSFLPSKHLVQILRGGSSYSRFFLSFFLGFRRPNLPHHWTKRRASTWLAT